MNNEPGVLEKLAYLIIRGGAASVELFLHRRFGVRYMSLFVGTGFLVICVYFYFIPVKQNKAFLAYGILFVVSWLLTSIKTWIRYSMGDNEHSLYRGYPRLLSRNRPHREYLTKQFVEPALVGFAGVCTLDLNAPLGIYWIFAAMCVFAANANDRRVQNREAMIMHDAVVEQQLRASRFQQIHGVRD